MKLGWNIAAGFANSAWSAAVILLTVPFFLRYLGVPAYGLIGFFTSLQALFGLLDVGLGPTINREVARGLSPDDKIKTRHLLHTLAIAYGAVAVSIAATVALLAPWIGRHWLNASTLTTKDVVEALSLMGLVIACRFPLSLYLGALIGAGKMVTASGIEIVMVTLANAGAVIVLALIAPTIQAFFLWQAFVGLANLVVVRWAAWRALRVAGDNDRPRFDMTGLRRIWRFSAGMAATAVLGAVFLQSDKVILSRIVSLDALGRYTLAGLVARSLYVFVAPVFAGVFPRLTAMHAAGDIAGVTRLYTNGTRALMAVIFPVSCFVAVFATDLITLWTGNAPLAKSAEVVVILLIIGTAFNAAMHFPYALQLAYGKSNLPAMINATLLIVFAPLVIVLATKYGIVGGAAAWAILNVLYLVLGTWVTHRTLLRGAGMAWIVNGVGVPLVIAVAVAGFGGWATRQLDLGVVADILIGGGLTGVAALLTVALSPALVRDLRALKASTF